MLDREVRDTLERIGGRQTVLSACPVCGREVTSGHDRIRAWPGKWAHARCSRYVRGAHRRHRGEPTVG
jgi:hypothetical protein